VTSITADGDAAVHSIAREVFSEDVVSNRDPNHYTKGVQNCLNDLVEAHPCLATITSKIKPHFLLGMPLFLPISPV
jgi:hypothetical protein